MNNRGLKKQLARQLSFLERSAAAFDAGHRDEAVRIATTIRVMIHDTNKSTSLLTNLGVKNTVTLLNTVIPPAVEGRLAIFDGVMCMTSEGVKPKLGLGPTTYLPVADWWNQIVIVAGFGNELTRRLLVLDAANKDGGAHVDLQISKQYQIMVEGMWSFTKLKGDTRNSTPVTDHQFIALRQFAYELLNSPDLLACAV